jgi:quercetin dioxygenase-like cupin family protein
MIAFAHEPPAWQAGIGAIRAHLAESSAAIQRLADHYLQDPTSLRRIIELREDGTAPALIFGGRVTLYPLLRIPPCAVAMVSVVADGKGPVLWPKHAHEKETEILYVHAGVLRLQMAPNVEYECAEGAVQMIGAGIEHSVEMDPGSLVVAITCPGDRDFPKPYKGGDDNGIG